MYDLSKIDRETGRPNEEFMAALKARALKCVEHVERYGIASAAAAARRIRHCVWENQHWTERKWDTSSEAAYPFQGASDIRYRLSDFLVNQRVAEAFNALVRGQASFGSAGEGMEKEAKWCANAWRDLTRRRMPLEWIVQNLLLSNFAHGGGRGVAGCWTGWKETWEMRTTRISRADALALWTAWRAQSAGEDATISVQGFEMATAKDMAAILMELKLCRTRIEANEAAEDLMARDACDVSEPRIATARPEMRAMALGDTFWLPPDAPVANMDDADDFHMTEWRSAAEIRAMAKTERWHADFRDALLESVQEDRVSASAFPFYDEAEIGGDMQVVRAEAEAMRGKAQIIRSYLKAADEDGTTGRYCVIWSAAAEGLTGRGARLTRTPHGGWPVQLYASEVAGPYALDSRGVPSLAAGMQAHGKMCHETLANISMLQLPPVKTKGLRDEGQLLIEPLGEIALRTAGDVQFMTPPQVPMSTIRYLESLDQWRDLYFGLPGEKTPAQIWSNAQNLRVALFLGQSAETTRRLLAIDAAHRPQDQLPEGLRNGAPMLPVQIQCDPREWDMEHLEKLTNVLGAVMPMDKHGTVKSVPLVQSLMLGLMPSHADAINLDEDSAAEEELKDEQQNYLLVRAGIRPNIVAEGNYDFQGRLAFYEQMMQANPAVFDDLSPDKRQLLSEHVAALEMGVKQQANVGIGRTGVKPKVGAVGEA